LGARKPKGTKQDSQTLAKVTYTRRRR